MKNCMTDVHGTSCFVIKFGKAGEQIAKEMWEKKVKWFTLLSQPLPVKETAGRSKELVSASKVPWTWYRSR